MSRMDTKAAFVFTGGGSLGAIQVGMLRALLSHGVQPDFVVGASVGALNATYFAGAPNIEGVAMLERIWCGLRRSDVFPISLASVIGLLRHPGNIADPGGLRRLIETNLPYAKLEDTIIPLNIMATNQQGQGVHLNSGPAAEAILASTAIPGVFPHVHIDGEALMDGAGQSGEWSRCHQQGSAVRAGRMARIPLIVSSIKTSRHTSPKCPDERRNARSDSAFVPSPDSPGVSVFRGCARLSTSSW